MYRTRLAACLALVLSGCGDVPDIIFEDETPDIIIEHVYHFEEDSTPDVVYITEEDTTPDVVYVTEEDTTPDVVQEFYGDASSLPVLLWTEIGEPPMPKKLTDLTAATEVNDADQIWLEQAGTSKRIPASAFLLPTNYIGGLITSNGTDADHDIDIAPGVARSADDTAALKLPAALTKQIDAAWAVGSDQGGLDTGSVASATLYAVWLIKRPDTGVVDALFSLSFTAPTMPTNYTKKRLIAAVKTRDASANIVAYRQSGDHFVYISDAVQDELVDVIDDTITAGVFEDGTLSVPPNCLANVLGSVSNSSSTTSIILLAIKAKGAFTGTFDIVGAFAGFAIDSPNEANSCAGAGMVLVDDNSQIEYAANEATGSAGVRIITTGFQMLTRRDP